MNKQLPCIGIIGGTGQLGRAIALGLLGHGTVEASQLWISSRDDNQAVFSPYPEVKITHENQELVDACQIIILSVPPHLFPTVTINAENHLVISVMAGITIEKIQEATKSHRVVRAMSSPAANRSLAYSPWCPSEDLSNEDKAFTHAVFSACGETDEVPDENQIDLFTAMTGPVPGFVAYFADAMINYAVGQGIHQKIADKAIRQLFYASGTIFSHEAATPKDYVTEMVDYGGTTAAGLQKMKSSPLASLIEQGLAAAYQKAKQIG